MWGGTWKCRGYVPRWSLRLDETFDAAFFFFLRVKFFKAAFENVKKG